MEGGWKVLERRAGAQGSLQAWAQDQRTLASTVQQEKQIPWSSSHKGVVKPIFPIKMTERGVNIVRK